MAAITTKLHFLSHYLTSSSLTAVAAAAAVISTLALQGTMEKIEIFREFEIKMSWGRITGSTD